MCPFPRMLFLHSLFMGLVAQGHCLQLPSLGKSAQVPHPGVVSGCPQPMRLQSMPLSLITVKKQPGSGSLCLWSPWDETTAGTLALESPVSPPWHVLVPWRAPLHGGRTWSGGGVVQHPVAPFLSLGRSTLALALHPWGQSCCRGSEAPAELACDGKSWTEGC